MDDSDKESLHEKKGVYERVEDAADDQDDQEPPAYEDVANALVLLVERDGSRRRIYKRQDTGEILYTTRNFNGWKGYLKHYYKSYVLPENESPKSGDFASSSSAASSSTSSHTALPYATFDNFVISSVHPATGIQVSSREKQLFTRPKWKSGGSHELFSVQGRQYKLSAGWKGHVALRRPNETRKDPFLAYFKHKTLGLGTDQGSVTLNPSLVYEGPVESAPADALMINGKPTLLLDVALVGDYAVCRLVEAQAAGTSANALSRLSTKTGSSEPLF